MQGIEISTPDQEQPIEAARLQEISKPKIIRQEQQTSKNLDSTIFLGSFKNEIAPTAVISVEQRPDEAIVVHCNDLYEYLKFGYREDQAEVAKIEKYKEIFNAFSTPETVSTAMQLTGQLPEEDRAWIMDKLNTELKDQIEQISFKHTLKVLNGNLSTMFYDKTTLYFEASNEDDLRKTGFSKDLLPKVNLIKKSRI